jgi:hypothetical protein
MIQRDAAIQKLIASKLASALWKLRVASTGSTAVSRQEQSM